MKNRLLNLIAAPCGSDQQRLHLPDMHLEVVDGSFRQRQGRLGLCHVHIESIWKSSLTFGEDDETPRSSGHGRATEKQREAAAEIAIAALSFLADEQERLERFLAFSGLGPESLRAAARDPRFLGGVLDYVSGDESLLLAFAGDYGIDPQEIERARAALSGRPEDTGAG